MPPRCWYIRRRGTERSELPMHTQFTRRHFCAIADVLQQQPEGEHKQELVADFARYLATTNERFDRERFERACKSTQTAPPPRSPAVVTLVYQAGLANVFNTT